MNKILRADIIHLKMIKKGVFVPLPDGYEMRAMPKPSVQEWRDFYDKIGNQYLWWEKKLWRDAQLAQYINHDKYYYGLYKNNEILGFAELDMTLMPICDLAYFGLLPQAARLGLGFGFLTQVLFAAWQENPRHISVNTCLLDHPNALKNYLRAGFTLNYCEERTIQDPRDGLLFPKNQALPPHYYHQS